ncbi:MAG: hypothetical protein ACRCXZ_09305 [Patescibacteria group bacterium]
MTQNNDRTIRNADGTVDIWADAGLNKEAHIWGRKIHCIDSPAYLKPPSDVPKVLPLPQPTQPQE